MLFWRLSFHFTVPCLQSILCAAGLDALRIELQESTMHGCPPSAKWTGSRIEGGDCERRGNRAASVVSGVGCHSQKLALGEQAELPETESARQERELMPERSNGDSSNQGSNLTPWGARKDFSVPTSHSSSRERTHISRSPFGCNSSRDKFPAAEKKSPVPPSDMGLGWIRTESASAELLSPEVAEERC